jgi:uncharacterized radical SAM superfamily protein
VTEPAPRGGWSKLAAAVEALDGVALDATLVEAFECRSARDGGAAPPLRFHVPTFRAYATSELDNRGATAWPAISITGGECKLACDHCQAKILEPMIPARTPQELWRVINEQLARGARGMLLSGGSNRRNEVEYDAYYPVVRRAKDEFPGFTIALHTALVDRDVARRMEEAGVDVAMMDVIGAQDTVSQVYHLRRPVADFERSLEALVATSMKVVPHIVVGLHYGRLLGEWHALEIVARQRPDALVLVVVMPIHAARHRPFVAPAAAEVGRLFLDARSVLPEMPIMLGCARPAGVTRTQIDAYAVMAGLNAIAHPADGMVELALRLGREVSVSPTCCSLAADEELLFGADGGARIDPARVVAHEHSRAHARGRLVRIPVVVA